jgi:hypothetical protein
VKSLQKIAHPNVIKLREVLRVGKEVHLVFEFADLNLLQRITAAGTVPLP